MLAPDAILKAAEKQIAFLAASRALLDLQLADQPSTLGDHKKLATDHEAELSQINRRFAKVRKDLQDRLKAAGAAAAAATNKIHRLEQEIDKARTVLQRMTEAEESLTGEITELQAALTRALDDKRSVYEDQLAALASRKALQQAPVRDAETAARQAHEAYVQLLQEIHEASHLPLDTLDQLVAACIQPLINHKLVGTVNPPGPAASAKPARAAARPPKKNGTPRILEVAAGENRAAPAPLPPDLDENDPAPATADDHPNGSRGAPLEEHRHLS